LARAGVAQWERFKNLKNRPGIKIHYWPGGAYLRLIIYLAGSKKILVML
jgi:hypothetical protein